MNYVKLLPDTPARMHFTDWYKVTREITDVDRGGKKPIDSLVFWVDELGGTPVAKTFSILSEKLRLLLDPYLAGDAYKSYDFVITKSGEGFATEFSVEAILLGQ